MLHTLCQNPLTAQPVSLHLYMYSQCNQVPRVEASPTFAQKKIGTKQVEMVEIGNRYCSIGLHITSNKEPRMTRTG